MVFSGPFINQIEVAADMVLAKVRPGFAIALDPRIGHERRIPFAHDEHPEYVNAVVNVLQLFRHWLAVGIVVLIYMLSNQVYTVEFVVNVERGEIATFFVVQRYRALTRALKSFLRNTDVHV